MGEAAEWKKKPGKYGAWYRNDVHLKKRVNFNAGGVICKKSGGGKGFFQEKIRPVLIFADLYDTFILN